MSAPCPEYGFDLTLQLAPGLSDDAQHALFGAFDEATRALGLDAEGGGGSASWRFTVRRDGAQAADADRAALAAWAAGRPEVARCVPGPLVDLAGRPRGGISLQLIHGERPPRA